MSDEQAGDPTIDSVETEWGMFNKGDRIEVVEDNEDGGYFVGDDGEVVGFEKIGKGLFNPTPRTAILVQIDGQDEPVEVRPEDMKALA